MPHPIVEISELTQLVANHLLLDGPESLTSLACTCRALEELALSTPWSKQSSLTTLAESTIPSAALLPFGHHHRYVVVVVTWLVSDRFLRPIRIEWARFQRYASWMR